MIDDPIVVTPGGIDAGAAPASAGPRLLGRTERGTPIHLHRITPPRRRPLVLVVAGQHGDEPGGRLALERLLRGHREELAATGLGIALVLDANPDGREAGLRANADGVDLNRDHEALSTAETRALHRWIRRERPDVVLDLHTYPSRRAAALRRGWVLDDDVLLGLPTHPAVRLAAAGSAVRTLLPEVLGELRAKGFAAEEYRLFRADGRIRRSSLHTRDLRNGVALRTGALTVLVEGRAPRAEDPLDERERLVAAEAEAVLALLEWVARHREAFTGLAAPLPAEGELVPIRARWRRSKHLGRATVRDVGSGQRRRVELPDLLGEVEVTRSASLPSAYAIPRDETPLLDRLARQGYLAEPAARPTGDVPELVVPVAQRGGHALAVWLEGGSGDRWFRSSKDREALSRRPLVRRVEGALPREELVRRYSGSRPENEATNRSTS